MILIGNQRGGAKDLALHLLKEENEHVEVHELRGFASSDLTSALKESYAISRGTRCRQFLFSLSLNPPPQENVATQDFEQAITTIEEKLGLSGQPRAIVFHEKEGRRHAHAVWSRIDADEMKAIPLSFSKRKMQEVSRALYIEHGWKMPRGLMNPPERDPKNFTLAQWQQAKRAGKDPKAVKTIFQDCWAVSDSRATFAHALEEYGFKLAKGDRRGFVALDMQGEVYAVAKWTGIKTKDVRARLGNEDELPSLARVQAEIADQVSKRLYEIRDQAEQTHSHLKAREQAQRTLLVQKQRDARKELAAQHEKRQAHEVATRQQRFKKGLGGLFERLIGKRKRIADQNRKETIQADLRDRAEKDALIFRQLSERRLWQDRWQSLTAERKREQDEISAEITAFEGIGERALADLRRAFEDERKQPATESEFKRTRRSRPSRTPEP